MRAKLEYVTLSLEPELLERALAMSRRRGMSISQILSEAFEEDLRQAALQEEWQAKHRIESARPKI
ncbi:MAG: hypothetical protein SFV19_18465 [Rhodospirillaceae bacterium]|nr:hypothetical protein [Rhodospirillaceae bacterium]